MSLSTSQTAPTPLLQRLERWQWLLPVASFLAGWISYAVLDRGPELARWIALMVLLSWLWLLLQGLVMRLLRRWTGKAPAIAITAFITQSLQQELLFFSLPFVWGATHDDPVQIGFMLVLAAAALLSTLDPLYERWVVRSARGAIAFQMYCAWVTALVLLPVALRQPVEQSAQAAGVVALLALLLAAPRLIGSGLGWWRSLGWLALLVLAAMLAVLAARALPAVGLKLTEARMTDQVTAMQPGAAVRTLTSTALRQQGLVAFAAIHAPRGLTQSLHFDWMHEGRVIDRIPATIQGSGERERGWRTWTRKQNFDADPRGEWRVDIRTAGGQLVGRLRFTVTD